MFRASSASHATSAFAAPHAVSMPRTFPAPHAAPASPAAPARSRRALVSVPVLLSLVAAACPAYAAPPVTHGGPARPVSRGPVIYTAHRGGALEVPENSMAGLTETYRRGRAQVLDVDVRILRDGTLVAFHDRNLERTTNGRGPVNRLTLRQWRRVLITPSPKLPGLWKPEHPPTLGQVLDRFGGRITLLLELKDPQGLPRLSAMLHERRLTRAVYVQSKHARVAARAHRKGLQTSVWRGPRNVRTSHPERWAGKVDMLSIDYRTSARDVRRVMKSGIGRIWSHTVNTPAARDRMLRLGCTGIVTDAPSRLIR